MKQLTKEQELSYERDLLLLCFPVAIRVLDMWLYRVQARSGYLFWGIANMTVIIVAFAVYGIVLACRSFPKNTEKQRCAFRRRLPYLVITIIGCALSILCDSYRSLVFIIRPLFGTECEKLLYNMVYVWPLIAGYSCVCIFRCPIIKPGNWKWLILLLLPPIIIRLFTETWRWQLLFESLICLIAGVGIAVHKRGCRPYKTENPWYLSIFALLSAAIGHGFVNRLDSYKFFGAIYLWAVLFGYFLICAIIAWIDRVKIAKAEPLPSAP